MKWLILAALFSVTIIAGCKTYTQGERIYQNQCANCHGTKGEGLAQLYPALQRSLVLQQQLAKVPCIILKGKVSVDKNGNKVSEMPAIPTMKEVEMANLLNYLQKEFTNNEMTVTVDSVLKWRSDCN